MANLPEWIEQLPGTNTFMIDPDVGYPAALDDLGVARKDYTQYWLEVAQGVMKLDFDQWVRLAGVLTPGKNITRMIRSDGGRKLRWNLNMFPVGERDFRAMSAEERSKEIRKHYRRIRVQ